MPPASEGVGAAYVSRGGRWCNPDNPNYRSYPDVLSSAANQLGITLTRIDVRNAADLPQAFAMIRASGADAIYLVDDAALAGTPEVRKQIVMWALGRRLPVASSSSRVAPEGGLVSLGTDIRRFPGAPRSTSTASWAGPSLPSSPSSARRSISCR